MNNISNEQWLLEYEAESKGITDPNYTSTDQASLKRQLPELREKKKVAESKVPLEQVGKDFPTAAVVMAVSFIAMFAYILSIQDLTTADDRSTSAAFAILGAGALSLFLGVVSWAITTSSSDRRENTLDKAKNTVAEIANRINTIEVRLRTLQSESNERSRLFSLKESLRSDFDKDRNGIIDAIELEDTFSLLVKKNQTALIEKEKEFNKPYVHQFVKVGKYLNDKKSNLQLLFEYAKKSQDADKISKLISTIRQEVYTLNLLVVATLDMIVSLLEDDRITFYSLYEKLDELGIFTSNYEREMLSKLNKIDSSIGSLIGEMASMNLNIANSIQDLSYQTEESTALLAEHLESIDSTMRVGNTLSALNLYQNYKTNKRLKG